MRKNKKEKWISYALLLGIFVIAGAHPVLADELSDKFASLVDVGRTIVVGIGTVITLFGFFELGMSMNSQDGGAQAQAFKRISGGFVMVVAPALLSLFV